jgi:hypothetical protein
MAQDTKIAHGNSRDVIIEKIKILYSNYGINVSNMGDDEFYRIKEAYISNPEMLEKDLKASRQHYGTLDIIV